MKKQFIIRSMIFLMLFTVLSLMLNQVYNVKIKGDSIDEIKDKQFFENRDSIKYLFMGDSYIMNGVDPAKIDNSFNYASGEENYIQTYYKLRSVLNDKSFHPEYLILPVDPSSFSSFRISRIGNEKYWTRYLDFSEISFRLKNRSAFFGGFTGKYFSYAGKYHVFIKRLISSKQKRDSVFLGYKPRYESLADCHDIENACKDRAALYFDGWKAMDENLKFYFTEILELTQRNNIRVILIKMPLSKEYLKYSREYTSPDSNYKIINDIVLKFKNVQMFLDYQNVFNDQNQMFHNPDHLNFKGAEKLSEMISKDLRR